MTKRVSARVCVVGAGVAGGIVALELARAGVDGVLIVEAGGRIAMRRPRVFYDFMLGPRGDAFEPGYYDAAEFENVGNMPFDLRGNFVRALGGSTLAWGGMCLRLKPEDFELLKRTGRGADWPIDYGTLEPFYAEAERTLQVPGDASQPGHPPRSGPFPLPALAPQAADEPFLAATRALGYSTQSSSIAVNTAPINGRPQCEFINACDYCPTGARFTGDQLFERLGSLSPRPELLLGAAAARLKFATKARAAVLELVSLRGETREIEAERFVICGGGIETPKLLLASAGLFWPKGVGNNGGHLGRNLTNHLTFMGAGRARSRPGAKPRLAELFFSTSHSRHFDDAENQVAGKLKFYFIGGNIGGPGALPSMMAEGASRAEVETALAAAALRRELYVELEQAPAPSNAIEIAPGADRLGLPRTRVRFSIGDEDRRRADRARRIVAGVFRAMDVADVDWADLGLMAHPMGTTRMSSTEGTGVVDPELRVHGTENVYVCGSSVFSSGGVANPTLTIAALAHRLGRRLAPEVGVAAERPSSSPSD